MLNRKQKAQDYNAKFDNIPKDLKERLNYMCDKYNVSESKYNNILSYKNQLLINLYYNDINIILYEEPEGSPRPRTRIINRKNFVDNAIKNSSFVHVYSITGKEDNTYMERLLGDGLLQLKSMIYTPCIVTMNSFFKTPTVYSIQDKFLCEIGIIRPLTKPDWDNIGKKYSDMYNSNIWLDDSLVISGTVNKYYSILPRVEIELRYLNTVYNNYQYKSIINRKDFNNNNLFFTNK